VLRCGATLLGSDVEDGNRAMNRPRDEVRKRPLPHGEHEFVLRCIVCGSEAIFTGRTIEDARRAADQFFAAAAANLLGPSLCECRHIYW
jgi:hypothetical protein